MQAKSKLTLVSHHLCPYVQRAAIALAEKQVPFDRIYIDLGDKPEWFLKLSPLGKVPVLKVKPANADPVVIFESSVILEYLEETQPNPLHPADALTRARHRGWIEYGSTILNTIGRFYSAPDRTRLTAEAAALAAMFERIEQELGAGPWFGGDMFSLVDAVYGPVFRYFDTFDVIDDFGILAGMPELAAWRDRLNGRASVRNAVGPDYPQRLEAFLLARNSALSARIAMAA
jgi:glutathione S-transferase